MEIQDFVQYHNPDRVGHAHGRTLVLRVLTNKPVSRVPGHRVWLVGGEGRPRRYTLRSVFMVDVIGDSDHQGFRYFVGGSEGHCFDPPLPLDHLPWFGRLLRRQANFSLGLHTLAPEDTRELAALTRAAGIALPGAIDDR